MGIMSPKPGVVDIVPKDTIAYHLDSKFVYVKPPGTYEQAIEVAQQEFPEELGNISGDRISLSLHTRLNCGAHDVRISGSAWAAVVGSPYCYPSGCKVIDVHVKPPPLTEVVSTPERLPSPSRSKWHRSPSPYPYLENESRSWFARVFGSV